MKNSRINIILIFCLMFLVFFGDKGSAAELPKRIGGKDRFEVAVKLSKEWKQSNTVILANYKAYADALAAGPLAYKENAPILLTQTNRLTYITKNELKRLRPKKVIIVGGAGSISINVEREIKAAGIPLLERISGKDRFQVAENIAVRLGSWKKAVIAYGLNFPDALAVAPYAARNQLPILLAKQNEMPATTIKLMKQKGVKATIIVGGEGSVSRRVAQQLPSPTRIGGKDRFEVAANIARKYFPTSGSAYLATGMSFADALTGSVLAAKQNAPILLTAPNFVPEKTLSFFEEHLIKDYLVLGGTGSVNETLVSDVHFRKKSTEPVIYFVPHADDEVLTFGIDIVNQLNKNRNTMLVLLSQGDDSTARDVLNGHFDEESIYGVQNLRVKCSWHGVYHDPLMEKFLHGHISMQEFGEIRIEEYYRAAEAIGVEQGKAFINTIPIVNLSEKEIQNVIRQYARRYPSAQLRTMSMYDAHPQHAIIGKALASLEVAGEIEPLKTTYFLSVYTDQIAKKSPNLPLRVLTVDHPELNDKIEMAAEVYKEYSPEKGIYGTGYHSVPKQFNLIEKNQYIRIHH